MKHPETDKLRILAVDDEQIILNLYRRILSPPHNIHESSSKIADIDAGPSDLPPCFDVRLCQQGDEAVEAVKVAIKKKKPIGVAFIDIRMLPGPDGVWTAEQIRKLDPYIEIVIVTAYSDTDLEEIARRVPPPDKLLYLQKPFQPEEILQFGSALGTKWVMEQQLRTIQGELETMVEQRTAALLKANKQLKEEIENRIRIENALRQGEAKFRNIITSNADAIIILDSDGIVHFTNPAAELLFGRKAESIAGEFLGFPVVAGERTEIDIVRRDGQTSVAEMRVVETEWEGKIAHLASLRDISDRKLMESRLQQSLIKLRKTVTGTIQAMAFALETRDPYTAGHQQRVANLARAIAVEIGISKAKIEGIYMAGIIHDIGKIAVPTQILTKSGGLTDIEFNLIKTHAQVGYDILKTIESPWPIAEMVHQHHERMDGSGYPQGLLGEDILLGARILGVADVVEAMASHRPYRPALGIDKALDEISRNRGVLFDPVVVDACLKLFTEKEFKFEEKERGSTEDEISK